MEEEENKKATQNMQHSACREDRCRQRATGREGRQCSRGRQQGKKGEGAPDREYRGWQRYMRSQVRYGVVWVAATMCVW